MALAHSGTAGHAFITIMDEHLKISVVIATYNRCKTIPIVLNCLGLQTMDPSSFEVIVVDDGSPDKTSEVVCSLKGNLPYRLKYLRHENHGICFTQNRGIREARAPIALLIADDIELNPMALAEHSEEHEKNPEINVAVLGGVFQSPRLEKESVFLKNWDPFKFKNLDKLRTLPCYFFWACNISFKRQFVIKNGLFSEQLIKGGADGHEDVELGYRLSKKGLCILYNKRAFGYHYHIVTLEEAIRKYYNKGQTWTKFRDVVDKPEIAIRYHVLRNFTFKDYLLALRNRKYLIGADRNIFLLFASHLIHALLFNTVSVSLLWLPVFRYSEKNRRFAKLMSPQFYRGVLHHYFIRGIIDNRKGRYDLNPQKGKVYSL